MASMARIEVRRTGPPLAVFALTALVFSPALGFDFVLDDTAQILRNSAVRELDLESIFSRTYWENVDGGDFEFESVGSLYRPLATLSFALSYQLWGAEPFGYHLENVLLHAVAAALVLGLAQAWGLQARAAVFAAALFGLAPIHIEPVASIATRGELIAALFGLLTLRAMARSHVVLASVALLGALLSKESAAALPLAAWVADRAWLETPGGVSAGVRRYAPLVAITALYFAVRFAVLGGPGTAFEDAYFGSEVGWPSVWLTMARFSFEHYLGGALLGTPLVFDLSPASVPSSGPGDAFAWVCLVFWACVGVGSAVALVRRRSRWAAPPLLFIALLGPVANGVIRVGVIGATRLVYLPYLGIAVGLGQLFQWLDQRRPRATLGVAAALLLALVVQTERRLAVWSHPMRLYADIVHNAPHNALALAFLASEEFRLASAAHDEGLTVAAAPWTAEPRPLEHWYERSFEHTIASLAFYPGNYHRLLPALLWMAVRLEREADALAALSEAIAQLRPQLDLPPFPPSREEWDERPIRSDEVEALRRWSEALTAIAPDPSDQAFLERRAQQRGLQVIDRPLSPEQAAAIRSEATNPLYLRALVAQAGVVMPEALIARSRFERIEALAAGTPSEGTRAELGRELDTALEALARLNALCLAAYDSRGRSSSAQVAQYLAQPAYARAYRRFARTHLERLRKLRDSDANSER